jgi:hypothetical protein
MKKTYLLIATIWLISLNLTAQNRFNNCSAAFLSQKMIVDDYSPEGKCVLKNTASGELTVNTATYDNNKWQMGDKISFKLTIRDGKTKTLLSFSDATYTEIDVKKILTKCQKGDFILISIIKDEYALPHNEILVE